MQTKKGMSNVFFKHNQTFAEDEQQVGLGLISHCPSPTNYAHNSGEFMP